MDFNLQCRRAGPDPVFAASILSNLACAGLLALVIACSSAPSTRLAKAQAETESPALLDLEGEPVNVFAAAEEGLQGIVLLFVSVDCPISNRYAPEFQRLYSSYSPQGIRFWLVYPDPDQTPEQVREHTKDYRLEIPALRDPEHAAVRRAQANVTPEAALFTPAGERIYHGRIDNRAVDFGVERPEPTQRDLIEVLDALLAGRPIPHRHAPAVGCYIPKR